MWDAGAAMNPWTDSDDFAREARKVESAGEALLLTLLWWRRDGWTVRTQEPIEQYRVDLFVPEAGVAIEVDSLAGHGSNEAMERDAKKRNLVVARGWAPLTFSAQQTLFRSHDALTEALAVIESRLGKPRPGGALPRGPKGPPGVPSIADFAAGGRALLAALSDPPADAVHLSASQRVMADRSEVELLGVEALGAIFDCPEVIERAPWVIDILDQIDGPVALAAASLRRHYRNGALDDAAFLRDCPALLYHVATERLVFPRFPSMETATDATREFGAQLENLLRADEPPKAAE